jgi:hypothetical protein
MSYIGWVDISRGGSPITFYRDNHPDYIALSLKERQELRAEIIAKFKTLTAFCNVNAYVTVPQLVRFFSGDSRMKPANLKRIRTCLENTLI